jgi:hypothetical protein
MVLFESLQTGKAPKINILSAYVPCMVNNLVVKVHYGGL